ncbi:hypothetical protein PV11_00672 [Exophiala sideris]|uniref:C2H2-type domain-containing protein n=1 Tax=Exophiala sideris TaxID=1016849 RepID=A0A0D1W851_9EURO|nr:hypothetical protein PV11_00672 [Exophiala sideris]
MGQDVSKMPSNQLSSSDVFHDYTCSPCDRKFLNLNGALNHCRNASVHRGEWCERCQWLFVSPAARNKHVADSPHHYICKRCKIDYDLTTALNKHLVDVHHQCMDCEEEFNNDNDLQQHKRSHLPLDVKCLACERKFSEFAAMMIHLESGTCQSGVDRNDIDTWVFDENGYGRYVNEWTNFWRYRCPTCSSDFRFASALLQHAASNHCDQNHFQVIRDFKYCIQQHI